MKRYVPFKYILGLFGLFVIMPIMIAYINHLLGPSKIAYRIAAIMFICGPISYFSNMDCASIAICGTMLSNCMAEPTQNWGWVADITTIQKIECVGIEAAQRIYKDARGKKVLLVTFTRYEIKYICVDLFTKSQIKRLIRDINNIRNTGDGTKPLKK